MTAPSVTGRRQALFGVGGVLAGMILRPTSASSAVQTFAQRVQAVMLPDGGHAIWTRQADPGRLAANGDVWLAP